MVVRDVRTRWNYTHAMIARALLLQEAINTWIFETSELQGCLFTKSDWTKLEHLADILEVWL
ncbi:hypothetical protein BC826DRAFT_919592 [Russula brevipes]|nr:hypothetical protein BC826DRAFT_919592 [Russula brevipes]